MEHQQEQQLQENQEQQPTPLTPRKIIDILVSTAQYRRAYEMAERNNINLEIKDSRGTIYKICKGGVIRRVVPKKIKRR